jgi:hypothetical protein
MNTTTLVRVLGQAVSGQAAEVVPRQGTGLNLIYKGGLSQGRRLLEYLSGVSVDGFDSCLSSRLEGLDAGSR